MNPVIGNRSIFLRAVPLKPLAQLLLGLFVLVASLPAIAGQAAPQSANTKRVLVIYSYHTGFPSSEIYLDEIAKAFPHPFEVYDIFLDTKRHSPKQVFPRAYDEVKAKLRDFTPDIVITFDDNALVFADQHREEFFGQTPIVFAGVNDRTLVDEMGAKDNTTGVFETLTIGKALDFAKALHRGQLKEFIAITNTSPSSQGSLKQLQAAATKHPDLAVREVSLQDYTFADAADYLAGRFPADTAIFFLAPFLDKNGEFRNHHDLFASLAPTASKPVYSLTSLGVEAGATAGYVVSFQKQASVAIDMAKRVLAGADINQIPVTLDNLNVPMINEAEALRHGLDITAYDGDVQLVNRLPRFWERNLHWIIAALVVLAATVLALLLVQWSNLRVQKVLKEINVKLKHDALHDALTGLPNRRYVEAFLTDASQPDHYCALFHIDLDRFKHINDTLGHKAGDHILCVVADKLTGLLPEKGFAARIGGDEFLIVAEFPFQSAAVKLGENIVAELAKPIAFEQHLCRIGASVGVAAHSDSNSDLDLFQRADIALHQAKEKGRGRVSIFTPALGSQFLDEKALADEIAWGLDNGEFIPYFQPQISCETGEVVSVEALARWQHPKRGLLAPVAFLNVAERIGLVSEIDHAVLLASQQVILDWHKQDIHVPQLSVNISAKRLQAAYLAESLKTFDLGGTTLCFELLESIFLDDTKDPLFARIEELRQSGLRIEIDDFGTGHASIVSILRLNADGFKIARELISTIDEDKRMLQMVRSFIEVGKSLDMTIVAEGVETEKQAELLKSMGCDVLQGYGLCHPGAPNVIADFIKKRHDALWRAA